MGKQEGTLTYWKAETHGKKGQQAENRINKGKDSLPGK